MMMPFLYGKVIGTLYEGKDENHVLRSYFQRWVVQGLLLAEN